MPGHKTASDKSGFDRTPEKVKEYLLTLATYLSVSEASFFPNNINPSSVFGMSSFNWHKLQDQVVATGPSLCAILHHSACKEERMVTLREVLRPVMRDPEFHSLRGEVSRLLDLHSTGESLPPNKIESLDEKAVRLAQHLALKDLKWLASRPKEATYVKVSEGQPQSKREIPSSRDIKSQLSVTKEFSIGLCKLMYGLAGNTRMTVLYFPYNGSFDNFLTILQSETSLQTGKFVGYTLEDGPWSYRIERNSAIEGDWCNITDKASFFDMMDKLGSADDRAMVFHSSELSKQNVYEQEKKTDLDRQAKIANEMVDEYGEPFFDGSYLSCLQGQI